MRVECTECKNDLERINNIEELTVVPYEWYKNPDIFEKEIILFCKHCKYYKKLSSIDKIRYKLANKIMGLKE